MAKHCLKLERLLLFRRSKRKKKNSKKSTKISLTTQFADYLPNKKANWFRLDEIIALLSKSLFFLRARGKKKYLNFIAFTLNIKYAPLNKKKTFSNHNDEDLWLNTLDIKVILLLRLLYTFHTLINKKITKLWMRLKCWKLIAKI